MVRVTAIDTAAEKAAQKKAEAKAKDKAKAKAAEDKAPVPAPKPHSAGDADDDPREDPDDDEADDADDEAPAPPSPPQPKHPLTKAGQTLLAKAKTQGLRARLRAPLPAPTSDALIAMLILALHADNVKIEGYQQPERDPANYRDSYAHGGGIDLVRRLITPAGQLQYDEAELPKLALEAIARTLRIAGPEPGYGQAGSGPVAEWIAAALDAQQHLPRLDTAEILATADSTELRAAAKIAGEKFTTATAAKRDLVGKAEHWRPTVAHYGAPGPKPAAKEAA